MTINVRGIGYDELPLFGFPAALVPDDEGKKVLLTLNACADILMFLRDVVRKMFKGYHKRGHEISDVCLYVHEKHKRVAHYRDNEPYDLRFPHQLLVVKLKDDAAYALDITGPQYGQFRSVLPFEVYKRDYVERVESFNQNVKSFQLASALGLIDEEVKKLNTQFTKCVDATIDRFEGELGRSLTTIVNQAGRDYDSDKQKLLVTMQRDMLVQANTMKQAKKSSPVVQTPSSAVIKSQGSPKITVVDLSKPEVRSEIEKKWEKDLEEIIKWKFGG